MSDLFTPACPACGFGRLRPADDSDDPRLVWVCELAGQSCRYIPRDRPEKTKGRRHRKDAS